MEMASAIESNACSFDIRRRLRRIDRRCFLTVGTLGLTGLSLPELLRAEAALAPDQRRRNAVIILWMRGGPSQHETWDPKPDAPAEFRGAFGATSTSVPGVQICDLLPKSAHIMHKWSIVRSLHHNDAGHSTADQICFTGYASPPNLPPEGAGNVHPSCGAVVAKQLRHEEPSVPAYTMIPRIVPGTGAGYLGPGCAPFETIADPAARGPLSLPSFQVPAGMAISRLQSRRTLLAGLDRVRRDVDNTGMMEAADTFEQQAWDMIAGPKARAAFDLDAEPNSVKERYGLMQEYKAPTPDRCGVPAWSQRFLLARRLVEHGVRLATVDCRWWDTHVKGYETMRDGFLPRWDQAYSALIGDLEERGLLATTLVLAWGEFGRTPRVNATGGRDHYPDVFSAALAGGKIQGGRVVGASDTRGALPVEAAKSPADVLATLYDHLGVNVAVQYRDHAGRPHPVLPNGSTIRELT
jgi:hypothetical protein